MDTEKQSTEESCCSPCNYTDDGYCLRNENDYCKDGFCNCPHDIAEIKVLYTCVTCETTQLVCEMCGEALEAPKTEC